MVGAMKGYLITSLVFLIIGLFAEKPKEPPSDAVIALTMLLRIGMSAWTIYLLCQL